MKQQISDYEVAEPKRLVGCAEFQVDSQSTDPSFCGPMEIRVEPKRFGIRWAGEKEWSWIDWHELPLFAEDHSNVFRQIIKDLKEQAREEGLRVGIEEAIGPEPEKKHKVLLLPERMAIGR